MRRPASFRPAREPTIALINIVFLMLVFFMVAGTLATPPDRQVRLVNTADLDGNAALDALIVYADGRMTHEGVDVDDLSIFVSELDEAMRDHLRIVPDRALPAADVVALAGNLRSLGIDRVFIVTAQGLP